MMVEILCAVLGGGAMATEVGGIRFRGKTVRVSQMFLAIDVARFMPVEEFTARVEKLVGMHEDPRPPRRATTKCWWRAIRNGAPRPSGCATAFPIADGNWEPAAKAAARGRRSFA